MYVRSLALLIASAVFLSGASVTNAAFRVPGSMRADVDALGAVPVSQLPIPILFGVGVSDLDDTWGHARSGGRTHEGIDIMAPRGTLVVSPTDAVVLRIGYGNLGGRYVFTVNPGGEQYYYAHLDAFADGLYEGQVLEVGDLIGYVGNSGNAINRATHLHFTIYKYGAMNPYPRLVREFTLEERINAMKQIVDSADDRYVMANRLLDEYEDVFVAAESESVELPDVVEMLMEDEELTAHMSALMHDLSIEDEGASVRLLQTFLIHLGSGPASDRLRVAGATGYFGAVTREALAEYQATVGIYPASGYFGPLTRTHVLDVLSRDVVDVDVDEFAIDNTAMHAVAEIARDLTLGDRGEDVMQLQRFLLLEDAGYAARRLSEVGATGYFGQLTQEALAEFQRFADIAPASGYFGPITRAYFH